MTGAELRDHLATVKNMNKAALKARAKNNKQKDAEIVKFLQTVAYLGGT